MDKMALKRLTHSDLTFFKCYYSSQGDRPSKQKALNLNSNILVDILYPELKNATGDKLKVTLHVYGPGMEDVHTLQRKILKSKGSKNWRLNGELIYSPEDNLNRYDCLCPEDIALIGFSGEPIPKTVYIDFISQGNEDDRGLYKELDDILKSPMQTVTSRQLHDIIVSAGLPEYHPVKRFALDAELIAAVEGDAEAVLRVYRHTGRQMSSEELNLSKRRADDIGMQGEDLVFRYLDDLRTQGLIQDFEWISNENAIAPYDFQITKTDGTKRKLDVKSTTSDFLTKFHISRAELITMAGSTESYDLYRVYALDDESGKLRIACDMKTFATEVLHSLRDLPAGVEIDSVSCRPEQLPFSDPIDLHAENEEQDG